MPPSRTPKEYKPTLEPWNVRSGRRSDDQENPQGGGGRSSVAVSIAFLMPVGSGWSLTVITQLDIEAGASQNSSGRQSIGRIANSYNATTSNYRNTTTTNSNNTTTDNFRAYKESNHNELLHTEVNGPVRFGSLTCSVLRRATLGLIPSGSVRKYDDLLYATT